jgi:hypothetical protein
MRRCPQEIGGFLRKETPDSREQGQSGENKPGIEESNDSAAEKSAFLIVSVKDESRFAYRAHPIGSALLLQKARSFLPISSSDPGGLPHFALPKTEDQALSIRLTNAFFPTYMLKSACTNS